MSFRDKILSEYFEWILDLVYGTDRPSRQLYTKLMKQLHGTEFTYIVPLDKNRASDGVNLRRRFAMWKGYEDVIDYMDDPCSILEMIAALAIRCEEQIMDDPQKGNRTGQWFWNMIVNLGLSEMIDEVYDEEYVTKVLDRFLKREYSSDGTGGLFTVPDSPHDMRTAEIWIQLGDYINRLG